MKILLATFLLCSVAYAQETIELVDPASGTSAGTIVVQDGEVCAISGVKYKVKLVDSPTIKRLKEMKFDSGRFDDGTFADYVSYVNAKAKELNKEGFPIQLVYKPSDHVDKVRFPMDLRNISFYDFLQTLCFQAGYTYRIVGNSVQLFPKEG